MEIADVTRLVKFHKDNKAAVIKVTSDNMELFIDNTDFVIWDDANGTLYVIRVNNDHYTQADAPINIITTTYDNIQYIEGIYSRVNAATAVNALMSAGTITDIQKTILDKFISTINNTDVDIKIPVYEPFMDNFYNKKIEFTTALVNGKPYTSLNDAITEAPDGASIVLDHDTEIEEPIRISGKTVNIDLNGKTIKAATNAIVVDSGVLNIDGKGTISGGSGGSYTAVTVKDGTVNLRDGYYDVGADAVNEGNTTIYLNGSGEINIYGGYYTTAAPYAGRYYTLNKNNASTGNINCYGGKFYKCNPGAGDDALGGCFVPAGYEAVKVTPTEYVVVKAM